MTLGGQELGASFAIGSTGLYCHYSYSFQYGMSVRRKCSVIRTVQRRHLKGADYASARASRVSTEGEAVKHRRRPVSTLSGR